MISSFDANKYVLGEMTACSWQAGWRSLLIRAYEHPREAEFATPAARDHWIVLVTGGNCDVEARYRSGWQRNRSSTGHINMIAPGETPAVRWRGETLHSTLHLHLPAATIERVAQELRRKGPLSAVLPNGLGKLDPLVSQLMLNLNGAFRESVPDLYAETAGVMLAVHLLTRYGGYEAPAFDVANCGRLRKVEEFMRENLASTLTLDALAREAGVSRFHLLKLYKKIYGQPPLKRLTSLRMEEAKRLLKNRNETITDIAAKCGYENPSHFATAFRRMVGVSPGSYRS
jgi:AraC family transcriptional regulator